MIEVKGELGLIGAWANARKAEGLEVKRMALTGPWADAIPMVKEGDVVVKIKAHNGRLYAACKAVDGER